jgi:hypothetical protein
LARIGKWIQATIGEGLYTARPAGLSASGRDLVLRDGDRLYYAAFSLPIRNYHSLYRGPDDWDRRSILGPMPRIRQVRWMDNGESLRFSQNQEDGILTFQSTANPYGSQFVVRVAELATHA